MKIQTLDELKAENAKAEEEAAASQTAVEPEAEAVEETETEPDQAAEPDAEDTDESDTDDWMQGDEGAPKAGTKIPLAAHEKMRGRLKETIGEQKSEIEQLREEISALKSKATPALAADQSKPRPRPEDFDSDADYDRAMDAWYDQKVDSRMQRYQQTSEQKIQAQEQERQVEEAVSRHYAEAEQLAKDNNIAAETYQASDLAFRSVIETIFPTRGDVIADNLIARLGELGEGSAKVTYYIGRNKAAQEALAQSLRKDPTGMHAAMFLGQKMAQIAKPKRRISQAPEPAANASGGISSANQAGKYLKAYRKAEKANDAQARWNARQAARKAGVDVTKW